MRPMILIFCLLLAAVAVAAGQTAAVSDSAATWQRYVLPKEELSFDLPQAPLLAAISRPKKNPNDPREVPKAGRLYSAYGAGVVYLILSFDNPAGAEGLSVFEQELNHYPGRIGTFDREVSLGGYHGKEYSFTTPGLCGRQQLYQSKNHVYVVEANTDDLNRPDLKKFAASLSFAARKVNFDPTKPPSAETSKIEPAPATPTPTPATGGAGGGTGAGAGKIESTGPGSDEGIGMGVGGGVGTGRGEGIGPGAGGGVGTGRGVGPGVGNGVGLGPGSQTNSDNRIAYNGKDVTRKILLVLKLEAGYTEEARRNQITGTVVLKCVFASSGRVERITVIKSLPFGLTEKTIAAARNIRFIPAVKDGKYVGQYMQLEYTFNLY